MATIVAESFTDAFYFPNKAKTWFDTTRGRLDPIGDSDTVHCGGDGPFSVKIPHGVGKFQVSSECGQWIGEMMIVDRSYGRCIDWLRMVKAPESEK